MALIAEWTAALLFMTFCIYSPPQAAVTAAQAAIKTLDSALASRDLGAASAVLVVARTLPGLASHDFGPAERAIAALKVRGRNALST